MVKVTTTGGRVSLPMERFSNLLGHADNKGYSTRKKLVKVTQACKTWN